MLNVLSDGHIVYNLSDIGETVSHVHQSARFTACSTSRWPAGRLLRQQAACRQPAAGGSTERSAGRQPGRRLETERTSGVWFLGTGQPHQLGSLGKCCKLPPTAGSGAQLQPKFNLVYCGWKISQLMTTTDTDWLAYIVARVSSNTADCIISTDVCLSVCLSVCHMLILCPNVRPYD